MFYILGHALHKAFYFICWGDSPSITLSLYTGILLSFRLSLFDACNTFNHFHYIVEILENAEACKWRESTELYFLSKFLQLTNLNRFTLAMSNNVKQKQNEDEEKNSV